MSYSKWKVRILKRSKLCITEVRNRLWLPYFSSNSNLKKHTRLLFYLVPSAIATYLTILTFCSEPKLREVQAVNLQTNKQVQKIESLLSKDTVLIDRSSIHLEKKNNDSTCLLRLANINGQDDGKINIQVRNICDETQLIKGFRLTGKPDFAHTTFYQESSKIYFWQIDSISQQNEFIFDEYMHLSQSIPSNSTDRFSIAFKFAKSLSRPSLNYQGSAILYYNENDSIITPKFRLTIE